MPLVIPCHRVLAVDVSLCGYRRNGGVKTKRNFLELEDTRLP